MESMSYKGIFSMKRSLDHRFNLKNRLGILIIFMALLALIPMVKTNAQTTNLALNKPATSSSSEGVGYAASLAVDGNAGTRWGSLFADPQWIQIDLGATTSIGRVVL